MEQFGSPSPQSVARALRAARMPIKIVVHPELQRIIDQRKLKRYEATKDHHQRIELKPDLWDLGKEANSMYDQVKPTTVEENPALG